MFKHVLLALKGVLFGISNAIPGVSGGTIAVITGIYEKLLNSINNLFKDFKKSIIFLLVFGVGALIGFLGGAKVINICLKYAAIPTATLFAGFVLGGVPSLGEPLKDKISVKNVILAVVGLAVVVGLAFIPDNSKEAMGDLEFKHYALLFVCGFLAAVAMLAPGISGMMIFMLLGYYQLFNNTLSTLLDFSLFSQNILVLLAVGLGILVGIFSAAKGMSVLLEKYPVGTNFVIFGFVVGSVFCIMYKIEWQADVLMLILGAVTLVIGFLLSFYLEKLGNKNKNIELEKTSL